MYNENYISIEVWNTQVGAWMNIAEADTVEKARALIAAKRQDPETSDSTYSIVEFKRTVLV